METLIYKNIDLEIIEISNNCLVMARSFQGEAHVRFQSPLKEKKISEKIKKRNFMFNFDQSG